MNENILLVRIAVNGGKVDKQKEDKISHLAKRVVLSESLEEENQKLKAHVREIETTLKHFKGLYEDLLI